MERYLKLEYREEFLAELMTARRLIVDFLPSNSRASARALELISGAETLPKDLAELADALLRRFAASGAPPKEEESKTTGLARQYVCSTSLGSLTVWRAGDSLHEVALIMMTQPDQSTSVTVANRGDGHRKWVTIQVDANTPRPTCATFRIIVWDVLNVLTAEAHSLSVEKWGDASYTVEVRNE